MDRLTKRDGANVWFAQGRPRGFLCPSEICSSVRICQKAKDRTCPYLSLLDKLAAYEDAEGQGRLVILPCEVGDTVWWIPPASFTWLELRPYCCMVVSVTITENKKRERRKKYRIAELRDGKTIDNVRDVDFEDIGKTVFLTRAEAEAALKGETEDV